MNLSAKVVVNSSASGGETLTVTCYTCGMPSSKEWAQKTRSRPSSPSRPFFPFLLQMIPPHGAILTEDGSTYLCAFCHASLESQWNGYELHANPIPPPNRKYYVHKFICAVCSVETYRKRVRALPFQEFPFLVNKRQPGSLTLGNNPLAVVCLDCSETLWAQSAEYDRWGLPIHKRHFNWMARPPPPEDSVEATVARLPSGETQLPRCPPTEPLLPSKFSQQAYQSEPIVPVNSKAKSSKPDGPPASSGRSVGRSPVTSEQPTTSSSGRKSSITTTSAPVIDTMSTAPSQPPVVTVAPMSSYNTLSMRKESMSVPPNLTSTYPKYEGIPQPCGMQPPLGPPPLYPRSTMFPTQSPNYPTFPWSGRDSAYGEHFPYSSIPNTVESLTPQSSSWSWLQSPSPDLLRYQSFMSSFQNRGYGDIYLNHSQPMYESGSQSLPVSSGGPPSTPYLSPYRLQSSPADLQYTNTVSVASSSMGSSIASVAVSSSSSPYDSGQAMVLTPVSSSDHSTKTTSSSLNTGTVFSNSSENSRNENKSHKSEVPIQRKTSISSKSSNKSSTSSTHTENVLKLTPKKSYSAKKEKGSNNESECKSSERSTPPNGSSRTTPYCKTEDRERTIVSSATMKEKIEGYVGKKWQWQSHVKNSSSSSTTKEDATEESEPIDCSLKDGLPPKDEDATNADIMETDCAIDLSVSSNAKTSKVKEETARSASNEPLPSGNYGGSSNKFMIAYLCQSETISPPLSGNEHAQDRDSNVSVLDCTKESESLSGRSSVIVSTTKSEGSSESFIIVSPSLNNFEVQDHGQEIKESYKLDNTVVDDIVVNFAGVLEKPENDDEVTNLLDKSNDVSVVSNDGSSTHSTHSSQSSNLPLPSQIVSQEAQKEDMQKSEKILENKLVVEKCVKESMAEFKEMKKEEKKVLAAMEKEQTNFLAELGLITPKQKTEIELNILISRCEHKTLPPLKMRAESSPKLKLREDFEHQLLEVAFDDPSLKQNISDPKKASFLGTLGLKLASKNDKNRRESEWRLVLTERIMREKRDSKLRGTKRPWDSYSDVSNLLTPITRSSPSPNNPTVLESLSLTMPQEFAVSKSSGCHTGSSDLLTTVDNQMEVEKESNTSSAIKNGMSIVYPKYIPSYVQSSATVKSEGDDKDKGRVLSILNVPVITGNFHSVPAANTIIVPDPSNLQNPNDSNALLSIAEQPLLIPCGNILKVPVITPGLVRSNSRRGSFTSNPTDDTDDLMSSSDEMEELIQQSFSKLGSAIVKGELDNGENSSSQVDLIRKSCNENWKKTREDIEGLVASSTNIATSKIRLTQAADNLKKLRKCLKSHQSEVKAAEKMLKVKEKHIFKQLRTLDKSKNTHVQKNSKSKGKE